MADISCRLTGPLLKRLEEEKEFNQYSPKSVTTIIQEALAMYFLRKDLERGLPQTEIILRNQPLEIKDCIPPTPHLFEETADEGFLQKGIIMPDMTKVPSRVRPDPNIHYIRPGEGAVDRLQAAGINTADIIKARRNKRAGRDYDKTLEQYFNLI